MNIDQWCVGCNRNGVFMRVLALGDISVKKDVLLVGYIIGQPNFECVFDSIGGIAFHGWILCCALENLYIGGLAPKFDFSTFRIHEAVVVKCEVYRDVFAIVELTVVILIMEVGTFQIHKWQ